MAMSRAIIASAAQPHLFMESPSVPLRRSRIGLYSLTVPGETPRARALEHDGHLDGRRLLVHGEGARDLVERKSMRDERRRPDLPGGHQPHRIGEIVLVDHRAG